MRIEMGSWLFSGAFAHKPLYILWHFCFLGKEEERSTEWLIEDKASLSSHNRKRHLNVASAFLMPLWYLTGSGPGQLSTCT